MSIIKFLLAVTLALLSLDVAQAATVSQMKLTKPFDYSGFTYTWTDADGTSHTSALTDKATNPRQILALLAEVYCNKQIPGPYFSYSYNGQQQWDLRYQQQTVKTPWLYETEQYKSLLPDTVQRPAIDGKTALLVEMVNNWDQVCKDENWYYLYNYQMDYNYALLFVSHCFKSVQLLDKNKYIADTENPGYLFSAGDITCNKFYFISKGEVKRDNVTDSIYGGGPLGVLYEQLSPVIYQDEESTTDFSSTIKSGKVYFMDHACVDVPTISGETGRTHEFTVNTSGEQYSFNNMMLFIPDRRFEKEREWYPDAVTYQREFPLYYRYADDAIKPKNLMYTCTQNDPSKQKVDDDNYKIDLSWSTSLDLAKLGLDVPQTYYIYAIVGGKRTLIGTTEDVQHFSYNVPIQDTAQQITFVITASPIESNITATSLTKTVVIPGRNTNDPFYLQLVAYRSRYDMDKELNIYKNTLGLSPVSLKSGNFKDDYYNLMRTDDATGNSVRIAQIYIRNDSSYSQRYAYTYAVYYDDNTQVTNPTFDSEQPPYFSATIYDSTAYVKILDRFTASTATNSQSTGYTYHLTYSDSRVSNELPVPVFKTTNEVKPLGVTKAQADADTLHLLQAHDAAAVTFRAQNVMGASFQNYTVFRDLQADTCHTGKAELTSDSVYHVASRAADKMVRIAEPDVIVPQGDNSMVTVADYYAGAATATRGYVPVLTTLYNGDASQPNTYGCDIKKAELPKLTLTASDIDHASSFTSGGKEYAAFGATLTLTPSLPDSIPFVYYYRLWRIDGSKETLLNTQTDVNGTANGYSWASTFENIKGHYLAPKSATTVRDLYVSEEPSISKWVGYIGRMYATIVPQSTSSAAAKAAISPDGPYYYISQDTVWVNYSHNVVTAVADVQQQSPVTSVTYFNVTGQQSAIPWQGVNIVVVRRADGSVTTRKEIRKP